MTYMYIQCVACNSTIVHTLYHTQYNCTGVLGVLNILLEYKLHLYRQNTISPGLSYVSIVRNTTWYLQYSNKIPRSISVQYLVLLPSRIMVEYSTNSSTGVLWSTPGLRVCTNCTDSSEGLARRSSKKLDEAGRSWKMLEDARRCSKMLEDARRCSTKLEDAPRCWIGSIGSRRSGMGTPHQTPSLIWRVITDSSGHH